MRHLLGKVVSPLRRTPVGFLDFDRLDAYTSYLEARDAGRQPDPIIVSRLSPDRLLPAQIATLNRLGLSFTRQFEEDEKKCWTAAFYPRGYALQHSDALYMLGSKVLDYLTCEFVQAKWPRMPMGLARKVVDAYAGEAGLFGLAKQHGINKCIVNILGCHNQAIPTDIRELNERVRMMIFPREQKNLGPSKDDTNAILWTATSIIGAIWKTFGGRETRRFLDSRLFSAQCSLDVLFQPASPVLELTRVLGKAGRSLVDPKFKLLSESGRLSTNSMFVVGVYDQDDCKMGEGFAPSILLAQKRACINALRKIYFWENHNLIRPSDAFDDLKFSAQISVN